MPNSKSHSVKTGGDREKEIFFIALLKGFQEVYHHGFKIWIKLTGIAWYICYLRRSQ